MGIIVHHQPANSAWLWNIHVWEAAWDGNNVWDTKATRSSDGVDFQLPDIRDPRKLQFKYHFTSTVTGGNGWEADDFTRRLFRISPTEIWTFEASARILYQNPYPAGVTFNPGDVLTFHVITQNAFRGGQIYVWNPYDSNTPAAYFGESARDEAQGLSTFNVTLATWMTSGFNLKLVQPAANNKAAVWEPDASNRVWRPSDGRSLWLKSGQCDVRNTPLSLRPVALEVLYSANLSSPPQLALQDGVEGSVFPLVASSVQPYDASSLFKVAKYTVSIYPGASYVVTTPRNLENPGITRPFPANPAVLHEVSLFALGASSWVDAFPAITSIPLSIKPQVSSSFTAGLSIQVSIGNGPSYETVPATLQPEGTWQGSPTFALDTTT